VERAEAKYHARQEAVLASNVYPSRQLHLRDELEQKKTSWLWVMWIGGGGNDAEGKYLAGELVPG
jgi:hypothetical protein